MLFISARTVYKHRAEVRRVLGARNTFELLDMLHQQTGCISPTVRLSPRGGKVFTLLLEGLSNKEIGERLGMSVSGVKRHREKMLLQNNCATILELIAKYHGADNMENGQPAGCL